jgi:hypothetical protein
VDIPADLKLRDPLHELFTLPAEVVDICRRRHPVKPSLKLRRPQGTNTNCCHSPSQDASAEPSRTPASLFRSAHAITHSAVST